MSEMFTIRAINSNSPSYQRELKAGRDARHALDTLEIIATSLLTPEVRARAAEAVETLRAALER